MIKRKLSVLSFILVSAVTLLRGQDESNIPKVIPPSPNAAALEKFSTIPVDYSTGVPSISYPMWSWQRGKLQFNLGLSYHAGGHKVDDMASSTGLGWALTGVGRVSRTVRGVPDDHITRGFMYTPVLPQVTTYAYDGNEHYYTSIFISNQTYFPSDVAITQYNTSYSDTVKKIVENQLDGEQDIFTYSINGMSGSFIIDKQKNIIPLEYTNVKIEMICNPTSPPTGDAGRITAFKITDDKGIVYKFEFLEQQGATRISDSGTLDAFSFSEVSSSWLLTKIIDPTVNDSIVLNYAYNEVGSEYETGFSENQDYQLDHILYGLLISVVTNLQLSSDVFSHTVMSGDEPQLNLIVFPDSSKVSFEYDFERDDLVNSKALTRVLVTNSQNSVAKQFGLSYSYFQSDTSAYHPLWATSDNDFNKRLRLDTIYEISVDSTLMKPTVFEYDTTRLNPRSSKNIDFWGYNVNPARNNTYYVPEVPLDDEERFATGGYQTYLEGADRRPDSVYVKAAILEKIKYPTGGFTKFEYECNAAFSEFNYYENEHLTNSPEWEPPEFGDSYSLTMSDRTDTLVYFYFKTEEYVDPRPEPEPPYSCFEDQQDMETARFEIYSTDSSFYTYVEDVYGNFLAGVGMAISLPLDKSYTIRFVYDTTVTCAFEYRFKAYINGKYYTAPENKLAGGLRIKKITFNDGISDVLTKEYEYNDTTGHSSATITSVPDFGYYRTSVTHYEELTEFHLRHLNRNSNPTNTLNFHNGAPLVYTRVIEKEADSSLTERYFDPIIYASNGGTGYYPFLPVQTFSNLSGLMTKQIIKDKNGVLQREQTIHYDKIQTYLLNQENNRNVKTGTIASSVNFNATYYVADQYFMYITRAEADSETNKTYEGTGMMTTTQARTYDPYNYYLRSVTTTNSRNEERKEDYTYSLDGVGSVYTDMITRNMLAYPMGKTLYIPNIVNGELSQSKTNYGLYQSSTLPMPATSQSSLAGNDLQTDVSFDDYDDKGNLLQYTAKNGVITSFVWGYHKQYPVAKIVGKSYSDAISLSSLNLATVNDPASDAAMRTELNKLRTLSGCLVTTLTYKPLVGATSETDPNGRTIYYEYDSFNRLSLVRDKDSNIVKKVCYNYAGQPVDCGIGTLAAWQAISSSCELDTADNNTGNMIVVEKDMNPASATYNQTRNVVIANLGACPTCLSSCIGPDKKCFSGVCATGVKIQTSAIFNSGTGHWDVTYHYLWYEDCSVSSDYIEELDYEPLFLEPECP